MALRREHHPAPTKKLKEKQASNIDFESRRTGKADRQQVLRQHAPPEKKDAEVDRVRNLRRNPDTAWKRREEKRQARLERKREEIEKMALEWGFRYDHPKELLRDVEIEMARAAPEKKPFFEALRDSVLQYIHTMYQPIFTCDCCSIRDYVDELYTVDREDSYTLAMHGITQEHVDRIAKDPENVGRHPRLCSACHHFRANPEQGKPICPLSRQNGVHPTPPSQKLADLARELTLPESLAVRTVVPEQ
eukprot:tig00021438_g21456.t1